MNANGKNGATKVSMFQGFLSSVYTIYALLTALIILTYNMGVQFERIQNRLVTIEAENARQDKSIDSLMGIKFDLQAIMFKMGVKPGDYLR